MNGLIHFLNSVGGIIGGVGILVAIIFGALYGGKKAEKDKDNNTINTYEKNDVAQSKLLATRDRELAESQASLKSTEDMYKLIQTKADVLEKQVTQAPSIAELIIKIGDQHNEMMKQMSLMTNELGAIAKNLPKASIIKVNEDK